MVSFRNRPDAPTFTLVERTGRARIPTRHGTFTAYGYRDGQGLEHIAYVGEDTATVDAPLVRVHSECLTGDVFGSLRCDCGSQLDRALEVVGGADAGVIVYVRGHEGRGIGLGHKLQAYELQDTGMDTVDANHALGFPADSREYDVAAAILHDLEVRRVRLLSNNPAKSEGLSLHGIEVTEQVPLLGTTTSENLRYLETKRERMAHTFEPTPGIPGEETA
jgi:3,4-dihydroxy 2-butanone 4-phosphate synthase/GTP cyclohydrolase II